MKRSIAVPIVSMLALGFLAVGVAAQKPGKAYYQKKYRDPVLEEMRKAREAEEKEAQGKTDEIRAAQKERDRQEREEERTLTFDFEGVDVPESPAVFRSSFHFPPTAQYRTGTCWCFATTSMLESEVKRLTGREIKLSEMHTVYYEYLEKVRRWVRERGDSNVEEGSETNAVPRIWKQYGVVPRADYEGVLAENGRFDHEPMIAEIHAFLDTVKAHDLWDETYVVDGVRLILDRYMGRPPEEIRWEGRTLTPLAFLEQILGVRLDDYVHVVSTLAFPFYTYGEYKVPDNWWHSQDWYNLPLDAWYDGIVAAVKSGYTVALGGDVSEPGYQGFEDAAIVPEFDIPEKNIDQDAREFRFYNRSSFDDHSVHLVGYTRQGGHDWFLIKDSARSSRWGRFEGYYFYREDYVRLKMLSYTVHRDALEGIMK